VPSQTLTGIADSQPPRASAEPERDALKELAALFVRLGLTAFGGPAAHVAMMEDEVVVRRAWITREQFLDLLGATNLIPGPNSTEMAIHIGHRRAGWKGLLVAGSCFITPAVLVTLAIAWGYVRFGSLPQVQGLLYGVKPVIIAVVLQALWRLGRAAVKTWQLAALAAVSIVAGFMGVNELVVLFGAGALMALWLPVEERLMGPATARAFALPLLAFAATAVAASAVTPFSLTRLFLFFAKVGSVLYGSGYVLLAFLQADLVDRLHWLTQAQLLDAVAVGQVTPGPVFSTATFVGYVLGGARGAVVATAGIFLPAFIFVAMSGPLVPRLRHSRIAGALLDGVNVGALALMVVVTWQLGRAAIIDLLTAGVAVASAALLFGFQLNSAWLVIGGALAGFFLGP
jgi:chromate transporter